MIHSSIHSFIQSINQSVIQATSIAPLQFHYYSGLLPTLHGLPTASDCLLCQKRHWQPREKDMPKVPTWQLQRNSNPRPFGRNAWNLPVSDHAPTKTCVAHTKRRCTNLQLHLQITTTE